MKRKRIIYWEFAIDIVGPRYRTKTQRRAIHKTLSRKRLGEIDQAALRTTKSKLPPGFTAIVS